MDPIPFKIPVGVEYAGLIRFELPHLIVEFDKWSWTKFSKQVNEIKIPVGEITSAKFVKNIFQTRIELQFRSMKTATDIPSSSPGLVKLQFTRRHRKAAEELTTRIRTAIAEQRIKQLENEMRQLDD
ncbi:MAG: hypothetical protein AAF564_16305 [Bacteroidota bacterium]